MIYQHVSYRSYLREVLADRTKKNSKYSLRAMAKQLGFASSSLSEVLNGSANFSLMSARKIASRLELTAEETEYLCLLVQFDSSEDPEIRESLLNRMKSINPKKTTTHDLSVDQFKQISEWYHSAIIEIVNLRNFEFTPLNVAKRLGISKVEAEVAIERLLRLEILEKNKKGETVVVHDCLLTQSNTQTNQAMRNFFRQMMQKASEALETQNPKERLSGYETMAIAPESLPEAKVIFEKFFTDMLALSNRHPKKKNVYHLLVHFFNLTSGKE